ncbi:MAG: acetate--CoA ligase family protein [bacterium]
MKEIIEKAIGNGRKALSEYESKKLLAAYGVPVTREELAASREEALEAASKIGYPVALKACSPEITHKTETGLIALNLKTEEEVGEAYDRIMKDTGKKIDGVLIQEMIKGDRELMVGLIRDETFGPCVMFGLGGIFTEALEDVTFRVAPLEKRDAAEMIGEIRGSKILDAFRGGEPVDREILCEILINVGKIGLDFEQVKEIDINPLIIAGGRPVAVDALVVL